MDELPAFLASDKGIDSARGRGTFAAAAAAAPAAATSAAVATAAGVAGGSVKLQREEHASCAPRQRNSVCGPASEQG